MAEPTLASLRAQALDALRCADPDAKFDAARLLGEQARAANDADFGADEVLDEPADLPGRPPTPRLVAPKDVAARGIHTLEGRAALLHAIAHIEFNAINLALDHAWRFSGLPSAYYREWLLVASEEALHFSLLRGHLQSLGFDYGDFDAHDGLWHMTRSTSGSLAARMALVPRTLEARGLDATPPLQTKFAQIKDARAVDILEIILRDEIGHVAVGNRWYRWVCQRDGLEPTAHTLAMARLHRAPRPRPPFNLAARAAAGFSEAELRALTAGDDEVL